MKRFSLRLWVVSVALFAAVLVGRSVLDLQNEVAYSYPYAVALQFYGYGAALFILAIWIITQAETGRKEAVGLLAWLVLAFASFLAILTSIPK